MDPRVRSGVPQTHIAGHTERRASPVLSPSPIITPTKPKSRGLLADLAGWPSYSDMRSQVPGGSDHAGTALHPSSGLLSETPSGAVPTLKAFRKASHLPTPQSPGNMASYLHTRTPASSLNVLQSDHDSNVLPTEFQSHLSSPPPAPFRPHNSIPTPETSPLVARSRSNGPLFSSQLVHANSLHDDNGPATQCKRDGTQSRASTPPRTLSRPSSTRPVTPTLRSRPSTPLQWRSTERSPPEPSHFDNSATGFTSPRVKDEPGVDATRLHAQLVENNLTTAHAAELRRPDYFKRTKNLAPSSTSTAGGVASSDVGGKDGSLLWSSGNFGIVDSSIKGKRTALFQETSEESFEESLMAGRYDRYRSDKPSWKLDGDAEVPKGGEAIGEDGLVLTEEEKRKKTRLAAFLDGPPRASTSVATQLLPVEIEGRGRVLMKVEPSEPQISPKPTSKAKRTRKRKKAPADVKQDAEREGGGGGAAPEARMVDGPNWPDAEFPWRSCFASVDGLSSVEREERLRYIENFLDRESDEDDVEDLSSGRHSPDEAAWLSPRLSGGKTFPVHHQDRCHPTSSDPADARSVLLSKKSIRAVRLRLLRRRNTGRGADNGDDELLCICRGRDDGRALVQCDACRTWYHLECIGIQSTSELGREEDPWFCANCVEVKTPPPVVVPLSEPMFVATDDGGEHDVGHEPPFLNAGLNPSPATAWTRTARPPRTPPRMQQHVGHGAGGVSWDEPPSSSSRGDPRTPQFNAASAFGDLVRVYGSTPGRSLEQSQTVSKAEESPFDPTSTPSRGIMFGLPFATPKDGRWGKSLQGIVRGGAGAGNSELLFHTPKRPGEEKSTASGRYGVEQYHGKVGEDSEEGHTGSGAQSLSRATVMGSNNVTPVERETTVSGAKRMQALESPLGAKRSRRSS